MLRSSCRSLPQHHGPGGEGDGIRNESPHQPDAVERWAHGGAPDQSQLFAGISGAGWSECQPSRCQGSQECDACLARLQSGYAGGIYLLARAGAGYRAKTCGVCRRRFKLNYSAATHNEPTAHEKIADGPSCSRRWRKGISPPMWKAQVAGRYVLAKSTWLKYAIHLEQRIIPKVALDGCAKSMPTKCSVVRAAWPRDCRCRPRSIWRTYTDG